MTIMNNALSGALAAQVALSTTSQNIANLQTKGYTRQGALLAARGAVGPRSSGDGVTVTQLMRFSDGYKNQQMWRAASNVGQYSQTQPYLTQLERVMGDDSASLSAGVDEFFGALNAVAGVDPTSTALRGQVINAANLMAQRFNSLNNVFGSQEQSIVQQRAAIVESANAAITEIAAFNEKISHAVATGESASALIDARDQAIDKLASQMALEVSDQPNGTRDVSLITGESLVIGGVAGKLIATGDVASGQTFELNFASSTFTLNASKLGGQLGGLTDFETSTLKPMQANVESLAKQLSDHVNTILAGGTFSVTMNDGTTQTITYPGGVTMDGNPGKPLFVFTAGGGSNLLKVDSTFQTADLAFAKKPTPPAPYEPGDISNLQTILGLKDRKIDLPGWAMSGVLINDADTQLVGKLGVFSQQNQSSLATGNTVRKQAEQDWASTSGVNQDEEAVNLVEYQKMYQANMKVISVANSLFDTILQTMG
jgi:flagellar hook-associated protein 1 FlgK